jgi:hypothetical protein
MLLNANSKWNVVVFGPASQGVKEQHWLLEALLFQQAPPSVLKRSANEHVLLQYITLIQIALASTRTAQNRTRLFAKLI